jgi:glycerophosphoryl diester phosphodiesterase
MTNGPARSRNQAGSRVIAHRGGAANAPENTLAALRSAARLGVGWVEVDVALLGDGTAVLFHDDTVDRCTDGHGRLAECTFADLEALDAGSWFAKEFAGERVPTLGVALAAAADLGLSLNLELKQQKNDRDALVDAVIRIVEGCGFPPERLFVSCFDHALIEGLYGLRPALPRGLLFEDLVPRWRDAAERCGATSIVADHRRVRPAEIAAVHAAGYNAYVYTVNEPRAVAGLWDAGLTGVITDRPQDFLAP